ncbi:MAG: hypothetical protein ABI361_00205 [Nitrososphaera sp.]|jgi:hypothetical protein
MTVRQIEIQAALIGAGVAGIIARVVISALAKNLFWRPNVCDVTCQSEDLIFVVKDDIHALRGE